MRPGSRRDAQAAAPRHDRPATNHGPHRRPRRSRATSPRAAAAASRPPASEPLDARCAVDRARIGLLFAGFLLLLPLSVICPRLLAAGGPGRASWPPRPPASRPTRSRCRVCAERSSTATATSWPAPRTRRRIYATPYQVKDAPRQRAESWRRSSAPAEPGCCPQAAHRCRRASPTWPRRSTCRPRGDRTARARRHRAASRQPADLPAGRARRAGDRRGRRRRRGPDRARGG